MIIRKVAFLAGGATLLTACSSLNNLPPQQKVADVIWLDQNWTEDQRQWFHHASQGTATLPISYEWFAALERPGVTIFSEPEMVLDPAFMAQLGFIPGDITEYNQAGLPVGLAVSYNTPVDLNQPNGETYNAIGFTCAACHTGQMTYQGTSIRYDGGPAMTNLTVLTEVLFLSMVETYYSQLRFDRFAERILGERNTAENRKQLKHTFGVTLLKLIEEQIAVVVPEKRAKIVAELASGKPSKMLKALVSTARAQRKQSKELGTVAKEGFTRLDALNRIGNAVFAYDTGIPENFAPTTAPVNYPHIWTAPWFDWVQYDGSVMQPMVRNAGEALGVAAKINLNERPPVGHHGNYQQYRSTVPVDNLYKMEELLAGEQPFKQKQFSGLNSPKWPASVLPPINTSLAETGAELYQQMCQGCHKPAINTDAFWQANNWGAEDLNGNPILDMKLIPLDKIGTDTAQAEVLMKRTLNTKSIGLNTGIYLRDPSKSSNGCEPITVTSGKSELFATALGAVVQETINIQYGNTGIDDPAQRRRMDGERLNCLQAGAGYKARPLNGIWATAPFLHNGSVPTLYDLLSPLNERPTEFYLGSLEFDPFKVGYQSEEMQGLSKIDTSIHGNRNTGHEFTDERSAKGRIGRQLTKDERLALVEYLKTL